MMSAQGTNIGMMDPAYFVGRNEIVRWLSDFLQIRVQKVEETASGAIACQLMDAMFPGSVNMMKVDFTAKNDYEFVRNYKLLQTSFDKVNIKKVIEVEKLCKGKYQDNFEFMQWMKSLFDSNYPRDQPYDAVSRRMKSKGGNLVNRKEGNSGDTASNVSPDTQLNSGAVRRAQPPQRVMAQPTQRVVAQPRPPSQPPSQKITPIPGIRSQPRPMTQLVPNRNTNQDIPPPPSSNRGMSPMINTTESEEYQALKSKFDELVEERENLENVIQNVESERDFYYGKLRQIEILLQENGINENDDTIDGNILRILYATDDTAAGGMEEENEEMN